MYMTPTILCDFLSEKFHTKRYGRCLKEKELSLPRFYEKGALPEDGGCYVARFEDLPAPQRKDCLFVCVGNPTYGGLHEHAFDILHITYARADILSVFNAVQSVFRLISDWEDRLRGLIKDGAGTDEILQAGAEIFHKNMLVTDSELHYIARLFTEEIGPVDRVETKRAAGFSDFHRQAVSNKEPFFYQNMDGSNYCINIFDDGEYCGTCVLAADEKRPFRERDFQLFNRFSQYLGYAVRMQTKDPQAAAHTLKSVFSRLLMNLPLSREEAARVMDKSGCQDVHSWTALVIKGTDNRGMLPENYLCESICGCLPRSTAFPYEGWIAAFCPSDGDYRVEETRIRESLEPFLYDMNFVAGVSLPFSDIFRSKSYFMQAACALDSQTPSDQTGRVYMFSGSLPDYMLRYGRGQFEIKDLMTPGLRWVWENSGQVDYWDTLLKYLDNECNASLTAKALYMHRSSVFPRLAKIKEHVELDTPEKRLYLRMCMHLADAERTDAAK